MPKTNVIFVWNEPVFLITLNLHSSNSLNEKWKMEIVVRIKHFTLQRFYTQSAHIPLLMLKHIHL